MTLNVAVVSPKVVVMSADRRLLNVDKGEVRSETSTKLTVLSCAEGVALICYNGIGLDSNGNTPSDWLMRLEERRRLSAMSLDEVLETIREDMNRRFRRFGGSRAHSYLVAFHREYGYGISMVSNYERADQEGTSKASDFEVSTLHPAEGRETLCVVAGSTPSVAREDGSRIAKAAKHSGAQAQDLKNLCVRLIQNASRKHEGGGVGLAVQSAWIEAGDASVSVVLDEPQRGSLTELPNYIGGGMMMKGIWIQFGGS